MHLLNLGQFLNPMRFSLDTGFHNFGLSVLVNPKLNHGVSTVIQCEPRKFGFQWHMAETAVESD